MGRHHKTKADQILKLFIQFYGGWGILFNLNLFVAHKTDFITAKNTLLSIFLSPFILQGGRGRVTQTRLRQKPQLL